MHSVLCSEGTKSSALRRIASIGESIDCESGVPSAASDQRSNRVEEGWLESSRPPLRWIDVGLNSMIHLTFDQDPDNPKRPSGERSMRTTTP